MKEWYSAKELAGVAGMPGTKRAVQIKAKNCLWLSRPRKGRGGGREYHISSLPEETRIELLKRAAGIKSPGPKDLTKYLSSQCIALTPDELNDPIMQAKIVCHRAYFACIYGGREKLLESFARQYKKSKIQIRRWIDSVEMLKNPTKHMITLGDERVEIPEARAFPPEALAYGLSLYASDMKAGIKSAYRKIIENFSQNSQKNEQKIGDYSTFTRIVKKVPVSIWLRIRSGQTGFELHGLPKIIREWTAVPVQSVICGDQKIFDYVVYDPETDNLILPEGYLWMDCSSRTITGCYIELGHYNQYTVSQSLREALRYGIPDEIYTDWGKPELAKHIAQIRQRLAGYCATADFITMYDKYGNILYPEGPEPEHHKAPAGKPWVKPIENIMSIVESMLISKNIPGYRKRNENPWENKEIQQLLHRQAKAGALLTVEQFVTTVFSIIDEHNKKEKQLKEGKSIIPIDFFAQGLIAQPRTIFDDRTIDYICLPQFVRKPHQARVRVTIRGEERGYYSPLLSGRKRPVAISVDPYDRNAPAILTEPEDGSFLDVGEPWHVQNPYDEEGLTHKRARQAELMKWVNEQARRIKQGFDLYRAPEAKEKSILKITSATNTAAKAEKEVKIYHLKQQAQRQELAERKREAIEAQKELIKEFQATQEMMGQPKEINGWSLPEGKERFAFWLTLKEKVDANEPLSDTDAHFFERYQNTLDYRVCKDMYEEFGELFLKGIK